MGCLWLFPNWLGSAQRGHKRELNSREKVRSGPGAQQPPRGKTQLLQPHQGVESKVWSQARLCGWCQWGAAGLETSGWGTWSLGQFGDSSHLRPGAGELRRTWRKVLTRGWGLAASCKMLLMLQTVRVSCLPLQRLCCGT